MQILLIIVIALHALPGVFWAGTTFALARTGGIGMESLIRPQLGAAAVTVLMGLVLWGLNHRYGFGRGELVLAIGAISAIAAAGLQSRALSAVRRLQAAGGEAEAAALRGRALAVQRASAGLLAITIICMVVWRYI